jgi:hypothetical protein
MQAWDKPTDPDGRPETPEEPDRQPPAEPDPETQRAPGAEDSDSGEPPPMRAGDEHLLDGPGIAREPVGNDNIREGRVGGVMGPPHASHGQGQGG